MLFDDPVACTNVALAVIDPITGIAIGSAILKGVGSFLGFKAKKKAAKENRKAATENLALTYNTLNARALQEQAAAAQATEGVELDAASLSGQAETGAAAGNVAGASVDALLADIASQAGRAKNTIDTNLDFSLDQVARGQRAAQVEARQRIAGVPNPSVGALALDLAGTAFDAYSTLRLPRR